MKFPEIEEQVAKAIEQGKDGVYFDPEPLWRAIIRESWAFPELAEVFPSHNSTTFLMGYPLIRIGEYEYLFFRCGFCKRTTTPVNERCTHCGGYVGD